MCFHPHITSNNFFNISFYFMPGHIYLGSMWASLDLFIMIVNKKETQALLTLENRSNTQKVFIQMGLVYHYLRLKEVFVFALGTPSLPTGRQVLSDFWRNSKISSLLRDELKLSDPYHLILEASAQNLGDRRCRGGSWIDAGGRHCKVCFYYIITRPQVFISNVLQGLFKLCSIIT